MLRFTGKRSAFLEQHIVLLGLRCFRSDRWMLLTALAQRCLVPHSPCRAELVVTPITVFSSKSTLTLGRQIAVNKKFVCYRLRGGLIRFLNINNSQWVLFRGRSTNLVGPHFIVILRLPLPVKTLRDIYLRLAIMTAVSNCFVELVGNCNTCT